MSKELIPIIYFYDFSFGAPLVSPMWSLYILSRRVSAATTSQRACLRHSRCSLSTYGDLTAAALSEASSEGPSLDVLDALTEASPPQPVSISQMMLASGRLAASGARRWR